MRIQRDEMLMQPFYRVTVSIDPETYKMLKELINRLDMLGDDVVKTAIRELYEKTTKNPDKNNHSSSYKCIAQIYVYDMMKNLTLFQLNILSIKATSQKEAINKAMNTINELYSSIQGLYHKIEDLRCIIEK